MRSYGCLPGIHVGGGTLINVNWEGGTEVVECNGDWNQVWRIDGSVNRSRVVLISTELRVKG